MQENFSGCLVLFYGIMSNHFHILLEVPPMPEGGLSDLGMAQMLRWRVRYFTDGAVIGSTAKLDVASGACTRQTPHDEQSTRWICRSWKNGS